MTREEQIEKAAQVLLEALDGGYLHEGRIRALSAALALPPVPAPSMQEIDELVTHLEAQAQDDARTGRSPRDRHPARQATRDQLMAAIRSALGHAEAEGFAAGREAGALVAEASAGPRQQGEHPTVTTMRSVFADVAARIRALPAPEVRTQDKDGER